MTDPPVQACEVCAAGPVEKLLFPVAVHFKGKGFYSTDYGRGSRSGAGKEGESTSSKEGESASSKDSSSGDAGSKKESSGDSGTSPSPKSD